MIKKAFIASIVLYIIGNLVAMAAKKECMGWDCKVVQCPDGYAVRLPDGSYLPCEDEYFNKYMDGDKSVLIKGK